MKCLSSPFPVCALIHPSAHVLSLVDKLIGYGNQNPRSDVSLMSYLPDEIPILFRLVKELDRIPPELVTLLKDLKVKASAPFSSKDDEINDSRTNEKDDDEGGFFPNLPVIRPRHVYKQDKKKSKRKKSGCTRPGKQTKENKTLLPGVFVLFCEHGKINRQMKL